MKSVKSVFITIFLMFFSSGVFASEGGFSWSFQQPTYLLEKENLNLTTYICDPDKDTCKVNLDFTSSVPSDEPVSHYACVIDFGFGVTGEENKCNPNTVEFPVGEWRVTLTVKKISEDTAVTQGQFTILHKDDTIDPSQVSLTRIWQSPSYLLDKENSTLTNYTCNPEEPECKINLLVTPKLNGEDSSQLTCEIVSPFELIPTSDSCNPNTSLVPLGEHEIVIKILEKNSSTLLFSTSIFLKNTPEITSLDPAKVTTEIIWQQPTYFLEKEDSHLEKYTCDPGKNPCKYNLEIIPQYETEHLSHLICRVKTDFGFEEHTCNPSTVEMPSGEHLLTIEILEKSSNIVLQTKKITINNIQGQNISVGGGSVGVQNIEPRAENVLPLQPNFIIQSGLDEDFVCKTDICQVNFLVEVPSGALCTWDFGSGVFETVGTNTTCNPGYVKFPQDSPVKLVVRDSVNIQNTWEKSFIVRRANSSSPTSSLLISRITLQTKISPTKILTQNGIRCILGKTKICIINFTGENSVGVTSWRWEFDDGTLIDKENPAGHVFPKGHYTVRLTVSDGVRYEVSSYDVEVVDKEQQQICPACETMVGKIHISRVLPNPPRADTLEWIELSNSSGEHLPLDVCVLEDATDSYELSGMLSGHSSKKFHQITTGLTLGNTREHLLLKCGDIHIDSFSWDFDVPTNYVITREILQGAPDQGKVVKVIDGDTMDIMIDGVLTRVRLLGIDTPETVHPRKSVEIFGKEASEFSRKMLEGKPVWITYDHEPVDHYGRRLAYIWLCAGDFAESQCQLFNLEVVKQGMGRMERRFAFRFFELFSSVEKQAKEHSSGLWQDIEVTKFMNLLTSDERESLTNEQTKEYLLEQEKILEQCLEETIEGCGEEASWKSVTEKISTLSVNPQTSGHVKISGKTWGNMPINIQIFEKDEFKEVFPFQSDELGEYFLDWIPRRVGEYGISVIILKEKSQIVQEQEQGLNDKITETVSNSPLSDLTEDEGVGGVYEGEKAQEQVTLSKSILVEHISPHFSEPLRVDIVVQGQMTDNRRHQGDMFTCMSRGNCSINLVAESNREDDVEYYWMFPDGEVDDRENPASISLGYGMYEVFLIAKDVITDEIIVKTLTIKHTSIPKKISSKTPKNTSKFTLDVKETPADVGGGAVIEKIPSNRRLLIHMAVIGFVGFLCSFLFRKS